ncbi:sigma-E factor negative regulatory protein [Janthinobacterium agaricidamnosum]|uniref:Anti sigma-E RseA, N-terminal domain protein n=1 Tax=Janthinobacterium agaricidamnosum NBRC 102515 = DSM 9628 TaxID=1349767 RepID=W0V3S2_9BURK|nr:sigma-E factor negative regulatory protein [Janthinobacterium agaricidamnosum]CDG82265.1 anti sigma-E RseA, N-terminal domain protein [Janthinobacterium agaricidamnosum NBRC 102515 = DSM 9628]
MDTQKRLHENISALADGELAEHEVELAFAALDTPDGRAAWNAYHQIGHALRSDDCGFDLSGGFSAQLAARLAAEHDAAGGASSEPASRSASEPADSAVAVPLRAGSLS